MTTVATDSPAWIEGICRRFTDATGWPLRFSAEGSPHNNELSMRRQSLSECCWSAEISDGDRRIGFLWMDLPHDAQADRSFLAICEIAEIIVGLINDLSGVSKSLVSRSQDVSTLVDVGLVIQNEENLHRVLTQLLRAVVHLTGFRAAAFFLLNSLADGLTLRAEYQLDQLEIPFAHRDLNENFPDLDALSRGRIVLNSDSPAEWLRWLPDGVQTAVCVSVRSNDSPIGTLWMFDRRHRDSEERDWHVLESIAAQISAVLERVVLMRENQAQHRLQQDLKVASDSQEHDIIDNLPANCGFGAAAVNTSRFELGGDLCELIPVDQYRTVVAVGDASGDSIPAAMVMSAVRGALRTLLVKPPQHLEQTECIVEQINQSLYGMTPAHQFMSMIYGVLNTKENTFTYTNAGHPIPIHIHEGEVTRLKSHGMLLGVIPEAKYERSVVPLSANDILIAFSDGVSEAMNRVRKMFRQDGIVRAVENHIQGSAQEILDGIWAKLESHVSDGGDSDDRTLLVIKMQGNLPSGTANRQA